jgi:hypothetical protein
MQVIWARICGKKTRHAQLLGLRKTLCGRILRDMRYQKELPELGDICKTCADINDQRSKPVANNQ